ncbi:unnamed protein product [Agarophyton chilense]
MGKCYCDYCDVFLTNDSVAVRKQHNEGNRHKFNVCEYYRQYIGEQLQNQIDDIVQQFEIKVASGLIRPTYGLPPVVKAQIVLQKAHESGDATNPQGKLVMPQDASPSSARAPSRDMASQRAPPPSQPQTPTIATPQNRNPVPAE